MFPDRSYEAAPNNAQGASFRDRKPHQSPRWTGHDAVLQSIRKDGRTITVKKSDGDEVKGVLIACDNYTLSVDDGSQVRVIFKHAIDEFFAQRRPS